MIPTAACLGFTGIAGGIPAGRSLIVLNLCSSAVPVLFVVPGAPRTVSSAATPAF
jgi:hypothetical protein